MPWELYRLVYELKTPVCIGFHKLGFIQRTRPYILGRNIWGALTANLTRIMNTDQYEDVGKNLQKNLRFMPFFPALCRDSPLLPAYTSKNGLLYRDGTGNGLKEYKEYQIERLFISAYGRTAVSPDYLGAEEGSLFETEFINPRISRQDVPRQVYFIGYLFKRKGIEQDGLDGPFIERALERIAVGGERKYGFGQLKRISLDKGHADVFGNQPDLSNVDGPKFNMKQGSHLFMHLLCEQGKNKDQPVNICGEIEPVMGLEYSSGKGFGQQISRADVCWVPGTEIKDKSGLRIILAMEPLSIAIIKRTNQ